MKNIVDEFVISLGVDPKKLTQGLDNAISTTKNTLKNLATGFIMPTLTAFAAGSLVNTMVEEISAVDGLSQSLNMNIETLQAWQGAAERTGAAGRNVDELFMNLNRWMLDADKNQTGQLYKAIEEGLLPSLRNADGAMKSTQGYALELAEAFHQMDSQSAIGLAKRIGITQAATIGFLQQGRGQIREDIRQIKALGVYTDKDAKAVKEFKATVDGLIRTMKAGALPVFRAVLPVMKGIAESFKFAARHASAFVPILAGVGAALVALRLQATQLGVVIKANIVQALAAGSIKPILISLTVAAKMLYAQFLKFMLNPWTWVIAGLVVLGLLLEDFLVWMDGGKSALGDFWQAAADNINYFKEYLEKKLQNIQKFLSDVADYLALVWEPVGDGLSQLKAWFGETFDAIASKATAWMDFISGIVNKVKSFFGFGDETFEARKSNWQTALMSSGGAAGQAISPADIHNATTNTRNTNLDSKTTVNIYGNPDRETVNNGTAAANEINGYNISQAVSSQAGI